MRKVIAISSMLFMSCNTTSGSFSEPSRSYYYASCLEAGVMVTTCECMEETAIDKTGISNIESATAGDKEQVLEALREAQEDCHTKTLEKIEASR